MQFISLKQQLENHRNLKFNRVSLSKCALHSFLKNISLPGFIPDHIAIIGSFLAISFLFLLDITTGSEVALHTQYIFPLIFIALHSSRKNLVIAAVVFSISLQMGEILYFQHPVLSVQIYLFLLIAFSNSICALVTRYVRENILEAVHLSAIDPLTRLLNRRALEKAVHNEAVRQRRYGGHFSVALIDLDGFKGLNDSMGHKAGDKALVLLAEILCNQTRQSDTIARLGGDEFVVLMPNTKAIDCEVLCHSLCHTIALSMVEKFSYPITASIGYTTVEHRNNLTGDVLAIADKAMYKAKSIGNGCVVRGYAEPLSKTSYTITNF